MSNYQPKNNNYYDRLGISKNSSLNDIKSAFFDAVKIYTPEQDPDNYKLIRESYDILINPISRSEYDAKKDYGDLLERHEASLADAESNEDIESQIIILKKIINLVPDVGIYRNKLGQAYSEQEFYELAEKQFLKANNIDPKNLSYLLSLGELAEKRDLFLNAESYLKAAWELDEEDYKAPRALASLYYFKLSQKQKAHRTLDKAIDADGVLDFQDFFCIYDKVHYYALSNNKAGLRREMSRIKDIANSNQEKEYACYMLSTTGMHLYDLKNYDLSKEFVSTASQLMPENEDLREMLKSVTYNSNILSELEKLKDSSALNEFFRIFCGMLVGVYFGELNNNDNDVRKSFEIMSGLMEADPSNQEIKDSVRYIRQYYPSVYNTNERIFNDFLSIRATHYSEECPWNGCNTVIRVAKNAAIDFDPYRTYDDMMRNSSGGYGTYGCPNCDRSIEYGSSGYSKGFDRNSIDSSSSSSSCFIATAVYLSYDHPKVMILRSFRDNILIKSSIGKEFVKIYYRFSPPLARYLSKNKFLSKIIKILFLDPLTSLLNNKLKLTNRA